MNLSPISPIISASLSRLRLVFDDEHHKVLESIFRVLFDSIINMQRTVATVVNTNVSQPTWLSPTLLNSWVWYGSVSYNPQYSKDEQGVVRLRGLVKNGSGIPTVIFTLPAGYRPAQPMRFAVHSNGAFGSAYVEANGNVSAIVGSTVSFALDDVAFLAEA